MNSEIVTKIFKLMMLVIAIQGLFKTVRDQYKLWAFKHGRGVKGYATLRSIISCKDSGSSNNLRSYKCSYCYIDNTGNNRYIEVVRNGEPETILEIYYDKEHAEDYVINENKLWGYIAYSIMLIVALGM